MSYDEVRQFVTSVANDQLSKTDNVHVPHGIKPLDTDDTDTFVNAVTENFDLNEGSLDGKRTTPALATLIYQRCGGNEGCDTIHLTTISNATVLTEGDEAVSSKFASKIQDFPCSLCWGKHTGNMSIPSWAGFNSLFSIKDIRLTTVRYFPFFHAPPSDLSTVYTALITLVKGAEKLGQSHILVTADLAVYSKAEQILWDKPEILNGKVTMRFGGMRLNMALNAAIGKLFGDGVSGAY